MPPVTPPELPSVSRLALLGAVRQAIEHYASDTVAPSLGSESVRARLPDAKRLQSGAAQLSQEHPEDADAARGFVALLEAAYLVAAADGTSAEERAAFSELITQVTASQLDAGRLHDLLLAFDAQTEQVGLGPRLDAVAVEFRDFEAREEVLCFAVLIAIADGELAPPEIDALVSLGEHFDFSAREVQLLVDEIAETVRSYAG
jgi:tellurite resistance protein